MSTELPTAREALANAVEELRRTDGDTTYAETWILLARELREGSTPASDPGNQLTLHDVEGIVCAHGRVAVRRRDSLKRSEWWRHADGDPTVCDDVQQETEQQRRNGAERTDEQFWARDPLDVKAGERIPAATMNRLTHVPDGLPQTTPSDLDETAVLRTRVRVSPARPAAVPPPTHGVCRNCGLDVHLIAQGPGEPASYRHDLSGQQVCMGQRTPEGDETFVHSFAYPAPQGGSL